MARVSISAREDFLGKQLSLHTVIHHETSTYQTTQEYGNNGHKCVSAMENKILFRYVESIPLIYILNIFSNFKQQYSILTLHAHLWQNLLYLYDFVYASLMMTL